MMDLLRRSERSGIPGRPLNTKLLLLSHTAIARMMIEH